MPPVELHATPAESPGVIENGAKAAPAHDSPHQGGSWSESLPLPTTASRGKSVTPPIMRSKLAGAVPVGAPKLIQNYKLRLIHVRGMRRKGHPYRQRQISAPE